MSGRPRLSALHERNRALLEKRLELATEADLASDAPRLLSLLDEARSFLTQVCEAGAYVYHPDKRELLRWVAEDWRSFLAEHGDTARDCRLRVPPATWWTAIRRRAARTDPVLATVLAAALLALIAAGALRFPGQVRVAITEPTTPAAAPCADGGPCRLLAKGVSRRVFTAADRDVVLYVRPLAVDPPTWYQQPGQAEVEPDGDWSGEALLGSVTAPPAIGDRFQLVAVVVEPTLRPGLPRVDLADIRDLSFEAASEIVEIETGPAQVAVIAPELGGALARDYTYGEIEHGWGVADGEGEGPGRRAFRWLRFDGAGSAFGGWVLEFPAERPFDASAADRIRLRLRAGAAEQAFELKLRDDQGTERLIVVNTARQKADRWLDFSSPLSRFREQGIRTEALREITLGFNRDLGSAELEIFRVALD